MMERLICRGLIVIIAIATVHFKQQAAFADGHIGDKPVTWKDCLTDISVERGTHCGDRDSIDLRGTNSCTEEIDVQICLNNRKKDGSWVWACGVESGIKPGKKLNSGHWTCHSSGKVSVVVRKAGDFSTKLRIPSESPEP